MQSSGSEMFVRLWAGSPILSYFEQGVGLDDLSRDPFWAKDVPDNLLRCVCVQPPIFPIRAQSITTGKHHCAHFTDIKTERSSRQVLHLVSFLL